MCGIAGVAWTDPQRLSAPGYGARLLDPLKHRGPDGFGIDDFPGCTLAQRRLSIIDLGGGRQPLGNEDGSIQVAFNGEIYNYRELRERLLARGHRFRTDSDTEVIVHLYEERGPDLVHDLRGMFAFALWDAPRRRLTLARDRFGKKPLVYWRGPQGLHFGSELKALAAAPGFPRDLDAAALDDYLMYQYVPHPRTIFAAANKLPPGHVATYEAGRFECREYWRPPLQTETPIAPAAAIAKTRELLTEAVRLRMVAEVPLGAFLSGGVDSTIIVGLMQKLSPTPVKTFSIGFPVKAFDETAFARRAAEHLGTEHHEFRVEPDAVGIVGNLAWHYDEPFADSSAVPTWYVSEITRRQVTVALSGDGGDELFCGYPRYQAMRLGERFDRLPAPLRALAAAGFWQRLPAPARQKSKRRRALKLLRVLRDPALRRYRAWVSIFDDAARHDLYAPGFRDSLGGRDAGAWLESLFAELPDRDLVTRTTYADQRSYLVGDILCKVDIASMAHGLEVRCPFLDQEVAAFAGSLPIGLKLRGRVGKWLLKEAFPELLPPDLRHRPKMGFGVPIDSWLRNELAPMCEGVLFSQRARERGWFDPAEVRRLYDEHRAARWDHSYRLWALLMLEQWALTWLDGAPAVENNSLPPLRGEG